MELETKKFYKFLAPRPTVLVTSMDKEKRINAAPFSFIMPVSMNPPLLVVAMGPKRDTLKNIRESREFAINVPPEEILNNLWMCSKNHPPDENELEAAGLTAMDSKKVLTPCIHECVVWFECLLEHELNMGDHVLVAGRVVHVRIKDDLVDKGGDINLKKAKILMHIAGPKFAVAKTEKTAKDIAPKKKIIKEKTTKEITRDIAREIARKKTEKDIATKKKIAMKKR